MSSDFPAEQRVLLRMRDGENRRLLAEWLADEPGFFPVVADSNDAFNAEFECVFIDAATLTEAGGDLAARDRMEPTFLPVLLLVPERIGGDVFESLERLPNDVSEAIDETIEAPIRKRELKRRLQTLLRAREYSKQLNRSRERYHRLLELMPEAVLLVREGAIDYVNEAAIQLFGADEPDLLGHAVTEFVAENDVQTVARYLRAVELGSHEDGSFAVLQRGADGTPVEFRGARMFEDEESEEPLVQLIVRSIRPESEHRERH
jgi:PAS domain S-box-containing protein